MYIYPTNLSQHTILKIIIMVCRVFTILQYQALVCRILGLFFFMYLAATMINTSNY